MKNSGLGKNVPPDQLLPAVTDWLSMVWGCARGYLQFADSYGFILCYNCLVLISDHTKGLYEDKWYGDVLHRYEEKVFFLLQTKPVCQRYIIRQTGILIIECPWLPVHRIINFWYIHLGRLFIRKAEEGVDAVAGCQWHPLSNDRFWCPVGTV